MSPHKSYAFNKCLLNEVVKRDYRLTGVLEIRAIKLKQILASGDNLVVKGFIFSYFKSLEVLTVNHRTV